MSSVATRPAPGTHPARTVQRPVPAAVPASAQEPPAAAVRRDRPVRFLHTSDWQLGMTRHFLTAEAQCRFTTARMDAIRGIGAVARRERCDFVVVAGDVFDSNLLSRQTVLRSLEAMRSIDCPVYLLPGNHDALNAASIYRSPTFLDHLPDHVHAIVGPPPIEVLPGVELVPAPLTSNRPLRDLVADAISDLAGDGMLRIVVGHGQAEGVSITEGNVAALRLAPMEAAIERGAVHYIALGDRHSRGPVGASGRIFYSGSPEVTDHRDAQAGDVLVVELQPDGAIEVTPHHVGTWRFVDLIRAVNTPADLDGLEAELDGLGAKECTVVRTSLTGTLHLADKARLDALVERYGDLLAGLYQWERHTDLAVVVDDAELRELGVGGFVASAVGELLAAGADDGAEGQAARDALSLLYRLAGGACR